MAATANESRDSIENDNAAAVDDEWWKHAVIYQIYPRSFMDSNGDGVGDLKGITAQLTHLSDMGITATWLSPIFVSPMVDFGYDISNFTAIQPEYGTMDDFEHFVAEASQLGIKVILDFVPNHTSDRCEWFMKSAARVLGYEDFYVWSDGRVDGTGARQPPNNWQSVFYGPAWTWHEQRQQFYLHQFTSAQPDLNYRNPRVVAAMDGVLRFWLDKGVSGFRVDAVNHLFEAKHLHDEPLSGRTSDKHSYDYTEHIHTKDLPETYALLQHWRRLLDAYTRQHGGHVRILMTEAYADLKAIMDYYEDAQGVQGAHLPFNFLLIEDVKADCEGRVDARDLVMCVQKWLTYMPRGYVANWVLGNHDKPRTASRLGAELIDAMHMLLLTLPGVAITYNGEEIGMEDYRDLPWEQTVDPPALNVGPEKYKDVSRDPVRTPFQWSAEANAGFSNADSTWLPVHPNYKRLNLAQQKACSDSHYSVYKQLVALRQMPTLRHGHTTIEAYNRNVLVLKRALVNQPTVLTIINVSSATVQAINLLNLLLPSLPSAADNSHLTAVMPLVIGVNTNYTKGSRIPITNLTLPPHQGIVCALSD